jgi:hypothetical protein
MAGVKGKSGALKRRVYSRVYRISLGQKDADLVPFFEQLDKLPAGRRNSALLAAIRGGAAAGQDVVSRSTESTRVASALDALVNEW